MANEKKNTRKYRQYDDDFKRQALAQIENGRSVPDLAKGLGVASNLLYRWRREAAGNAADGEEQAELQALRQQVKQLEQDREILKKALRIFSQRE